MKNQNAIKKAQQTAHELIWAMWDRGEIDITQVRHHIINVNWTAQAAL
jgi:flavin-binding protein dodecin